MIFVFCFGGQGPWKKEEGDLFQERCTEELQSAEELMVWKSKGLCF